MSTLETAACMAHKRKTFKKHFVYGYAILKMLDIEGKNCFGEKQITITACK